MLYLLHLYGTKKKAEILCYDKDFSFLFSYEDAPYVYQPVFIGNTSKSGKEVR